MGHSNQEWGDLAENDPLMAEAWDSADPLPQKGTNDVLDDFCAAKHITIEALVKLGTRLSAPDVLVFAYDSGLKYRNMVSGKRWSFVGSEFPRPKLLQQGVDRSTRVLIAEGETDGARLLANPYGADVAVLGAGAKHFTDTHARSLEGYSEVYVALDPDEAGDVGAAKISVLIPHAARVLPPDGAEDWADLPEDAEWPELPIPPEPPKLIVAGGELLDLEVPDIASWFDEALLPIGGSLMIHGWAKSFKSFTALDIMSAIAQGDAWCGFEPTNEPAKVCVIQFEIPWPYYRERVQLLRDRAVRPELWDENFTTYSPISRPRFVASDKKQREFLKKLLIEYGISVALIDPIRRATGAVDLNDEKEVRAILSFVEELQNEGITVIMVHHDNKTGAQHGGGDPLNMTGSGAFAGDPDTILSIAIPRGIKTQDPKRDIHFTVRNGPMISPRAFEMRVDGTIDYRNEPWYIEEDDDTEGPNDPAI